VSGKRILELGTGTGLVALCAGILKARHVICTDRKSLDLARKNIEGYHSTISGDSARTKGESKQFSFTQYCWGDKLPWDKIGAPPDLLTIADGLYFEDNFTMLQKTIQEVLGHPKSKVL